MDIETSFHNKIAIVKFACEVYAVIEHNTFEEQNNQIVEKQNCSKIYYGENNKNLEDYLKTDEMQYIAKYLVHLSANGEINVRKASSCEIIAEFSPKYSENEIFDDIMCQRDLLAECEYTNINSKFVIAMGGLIYSRIDIPENSVSITFVDKSPANIEIEWPVATPIHAIDDDDSLIKQNNKECDVLAHPNVVITQLSDVISQLNNIIAQPNNANLQLNNVIAQLNNVLAQTKSTPGQKNNMSAQLTNVPAQTDNTPEQTNNVPAQTDNTPEQTNNVPAQTDNTPGQLTNVPVQPNISYHVIRNTYQPGMNYHYGYSYY
jgi:hypothetical protein